MPESWQTSVRWSTRLWGVKYGKLTLTDRSLALSGYENEVFTIPAADWPKIQWPHYGFGATMKIHVNGKRYFVSFEAGSSLDTWRSALDVASQWHARLHPGFAPSRARHFIVWGFVVLTKITAAIIGLLVGLILMVDDASHWYDRFFGALIMLLSVIGAVTIFKPTLLRK